MHGDATSKFRLKYAHVKQLAYKLVASNDAGRTGPFFGLMFCLGGQGNDVVDFADHDGVSIGVEDAGVIAIPGLLLLFFFILNCFFDGHRLRESAALLRAAFVVPHRFTESLRATFWVLLARCCLLI